MVPSVPDDEDYRDGRRYHALVGLGPGKYNYVFSCSDMFYSCATVLFTGPEVYEVQTVESPLLRTATTVNWTTVGTVSMRSVVSPGVTPADTVMVSKPVRTTIESGTWSEARIRVEYEEGHLADPDTITLLWYDGARGLYVPSTGQRHDPDARTVEGDMPSGDVVTAVFGELSESHQNNPPRLEISYDIKDAYVDKRLWFDASASSDPDGGTLLFHWDFTDNGLPGPWVPGVTAYTVYEDEGTYLVVLRAMDGQNAHFQYVNITIREEQDVTPGPFDNPTMLFLLGSLLVVAFGIAVAYRLHRPSTYDDLFGKAYRRREEDEYSQLFRKLTQEELRGEWDEDLEDDQDEDLDDDGEDEEDPEGRDDPGEDEGTD
jgi:hypothetical protein